jgi:hypothetical protein
MSRKRGSWERQRSALVKDLRSPKYKIRVVQDKKKQNKNKRVQSRTLIKDYIDG